MNLLPPLANTPGCNHAAISKYSYTAYIRTRKSEPFCISPEFTFMILNKYLRQINESLFIWRKFYFFVKITVFMNLKGV